MLCPTLRQRGGCTVYDCPHFHPGLRCEPCGVTARNQEYLDNHLNGRKHAAVLNGLDPRSITTMRMGRGSARRHNVRLPAQGPFQGGGSQAGYANMFTIQASFWCAVCGLQISNKTRVEHEQTPEHRQEEAPYQTALENAGRDKYGVLVTPEGLEAYDLGFSEDGKASMEISLKANNPQARISLRTVTPSGAEQRQSWFRLTFSASRQLSVNPLKGIVTFNSNGNQGRFQDRLVLVFYDTISQSQFAIVKPINIIVGHKADYELIKAKSLYVAHIVDYKEPVKDEDIVDGVRPVPLTEIEWIVKLPEYKIPKYMEDYLLIKSKIKKRSTLPQDFFPFQLTPETHAKRFHALLYLEEWQWKLDIARYDQDEATLTLENGLYYLEVPGLSEKRPSLIVGDKIIVKYDNYTGRDWSRGYVHVVESESVGLCFSPSFEPYPLSGQEFEVRFEVNRLTLRRMHQALEVKGISPRLLFPESVHIKNSKPSEHAIQSLRPINRLIGQNYSQMLAVTAIQNLQAGSPPFVVFGPPGTGKTMVIVEAIRQIIWNDPASRILVCAPSNSAADVIAERLIVLTKSQLFRLYAPSRLASLSPAALEDFSRKNKYGTFGIPSKLELSKFRVVVSTCLSASVPHGIGIQPGHFSHIFIDEAGQACEPEALIAITSLSTHETNVILSGDLKQLGPVIRSKSPRKPGLDMSLLDRLTQMASYDVKKQSGITIVKLLQNYRSHPVILSFPNQKFYDGELECKADPALTTSMLRANCIVNPGFPLIFHSITGKNEREARSPSYFNIDEACLVKKYVEELKADQRLRLTDEHIGIISPYHAQCGKIRTLIKRFAKGIKVGSVEEFQGQERRVIIVSTVRSQGGLKYLLKDIRQSLGFVANPRRFNVAMTRAQALLIVIGDSSLLSLDPLWRSFLSYIINNGSWKGVPKPDWDTNNPDKMDFLKARKATHSEEEMKLMETITETINGVAVAEDADDHGDGYAAVERPWREAE